MLVDPNWFGFHESVEEVDKVIELINERLSWTDLIRYLGVSFKIRASGVIVARCVFHQEWTPSLTLYPLPRQLRFHCYGCGFGGHMIKFLRQYYRMWELEEVVHFAHNFHRMRSIDPNQLWLPLTLPDSRD